MTTAEERGQKLFFDLLETMQRTTATMERLDSEQRNQCRLITDAADRASQTAIEASEAFAVSRPRLMLWAALCASLLVAGTAFAGYWVGHHDGAISGKAQGYLEAVKDNAGAAWGNTPSGKLAYRMDQAGLLQALGHCRMPGYKTSYDSSSKKLYCEPSQEAVSWSVEP